MSHQNQNYKFKISPYPNTIINQPQNDKNFNQYQIDHHQRESDTATLISEHGKRSPVKYRYLTVQQKQQRERQWTILWLQCFAMFIFIYASTCSKENTGVDLHFFVGIMMAIPICARQTGANLNPAVSYSMTFKYSGNKYSYHSLLWTYIKAQIVGAVISMIVAVWINDVYRNPLYPSTISKDMGLQYNQTHLIVKMILSQAVGVFILIFFILYGTGTYSFISNNGAKYFFIAVFVYIGRRFAVMSGNQINLALTISQAFVGIPLCDFQGFKYLFIWLIGDVLGVILATSLYNKIVDPTLEYLQKQKTQKFQSKLLEEHKIEMQQFKSNIIKEDIQQQKGHYKKKLQYF